MSGYCGYDPALVDLLGQAMIRALDELDAIRCSDHEADLAMLAVAKARSTLRDTWLPFVTGLIGCRAMDGYQPATINSGDLINSWLGAVAAQRHWRTSTDPLGEDVPSIANLTVEQARALGSALSGDAGEQPLSADEIAWLATTLASIAKRADLVAAFLPSLTTGGWTALADQLGERRQQLVTDAYLYDGRLSPSETAGWATIDGVFAGLAAVLVRDRMVHPESEVRLLTLDMVPYGAALLVRDLDLDAGALAAVSHDLVEREWRELDQHSWLGPRAADILFETMIATDGAPTAYLMLTLDSPQLAFEAPVDPILAHQLVQIGTAADNMSPADAATAMPVLTLWLLNASTQFASRAYDDHIIATLAAFVAPHYLPLLRSTDDGYGMTARERGAIQSLIFSDREATQVLLDERAGILAGSGPLALAGSSSARRTVLRDTADFLALIDTAQRARDIDRAEDAVEDWQLLWKAIGIGVSLMPLPKVASAASGLALSQIQQELNNAGIGPQPVASARTATLRSFDAMTTVAASVVVCAAFDQLVSAGRIPAGSPLPPTPDLETDDVGAAYDEDFSDWLTESGLDDGVQTELDEIKQTIASSHEATANANTALLGA